MTTTIPCTSCVPTASSAAPITQTGMKGFLLWFAREQPAIFKSIATKIPKVAPKAFSNYTARRKKLGAIYRSKFLKNQSGITKHVAGLGDYGSYGSYVSYSASNLGVSYGAPISVNYTAQLSNAYTASPTVDYTAQLPTYTASTDPGALNTVNTGSSSTVGIPPIAGAANSGVIGTSTTGAVGALIGAAAVAAGLTAQQTSAQQSAVNQNLARAAAGLPPLNTSVNSLGVPTVGSGSLSAGTLLLLGGAAIIALFMLGEK